MRIGLDLAEISRISKLDRRDGGGEGEKGRREEEGEESYIYIHLFFVLIIVEYPKEVSLKIL